MRLKIMLRVRFEMENDFGAAQDARVLHLARRRHLESLSARRRPRPGLGRARLAARHFDTVRHHEGRIETDSELADQGCAVPGFAKTFNERAGARASHRPEVL